MHQFLRFMQEEYREKRRARLTPILIPTRSVKHLATFPPMTSDVCTYYLLIVLIPECNSSLPARSTDQGSCLPTSGHSFNGIVATFLVLVITTIIVIFTIAVFIEFLIRGVLQRLPP